MDEIYQKKREVLALDPIKIYEDKFGKKCHEWTFRDIYFFSKLATEVNLYKNFCLWKFGDTYRDMPWHDFLKTCRQYGFEAAYRSPSYVIDFDTWVIDELESQIILYHKERGLILLRNQYLMAINYMLIRQECMVRFIMMILSIVVRSVKFYFFAMLLQPITILCNLVLMLVKQ